MKKKIQIEKWYKSLPLNSRKEIRDIFIQRAGISFPTFYSKLARNCFKDHERAILQELAGEITLVF